MNDTVLSHGTWVGFPAVTLGNATLEATVLPSLGARIVSLRSRRTGREWLWRANDGRGLFPNSPGDAFAAGPLAGIDECLPTVSACRIAGRDLPDHGEAWTSAWSSEVTDGALVNHLTLHCLPMHFRRRLSLAGDRVQLDYELTNLGGVAVRYIWALHPLLNWQAGDRVNLSGNSPVRLTDVQGAKLRTGTRGIWPDPLPGVSLSRGELGAERGNYCKAFLNTAQAPTIALVSGNEQLEFTVDPAEIPHWGYWLTQEGWHGHTHLALEPTNVAADSVAEITPEHKTALLEAGKIRRWSVGLRVTADPSN